MSTPTVEDLDLREASVSIVEADSSGPVDADGNVTMHIIRPGLGRGRGRHLYEAKMLEANAQKFSGWRMFLNHLSPEAKKAKGGLPRDVQDLGGRIVESWWDPTVPAVPGRFGAGAVVAKAKPTPFVRELIENDPEIIEASISATATGVRPGVHENQRCWIVEGIEDRGSVDWVTEAGAGGRVVSLMEAAFAEDTDGIEAASASMTSEEFKAFLHEKRPDLAESLSSTPPLAATPGEQEDDMTITPESLREALTDEDTREALLEALEIDDYVAGLVQALVQQSLPTLVEAAVEAERDVIRATAKADADRRIQVERLERKAHEMVEATRLPDVLKGEIKQKFSIQESGEPTAALDVVDKLDDDGKVEKKAEDVIAEAVGQEIDAKKAVVAALNPTRVRGQGPSAQTKDDDTAKVQEARNGNQTSSLLQEAGFGSVDPWSIEDHRALQS